MSRFASDTSPPWWAAQTMAQDKLRLPAGSPGRMGTLWLGSEGWMAGGVGFKWTRCAGGREMGPEGNTKRRPRRSIDTSASFCIFHSLPRPRLKNK